MCLLPWCTIVLSCTIVFMLYVHMYFSALPTHVYMYLVHANVVFSCSLHDFLEVCVCVCVRAILSFLPTTPKMCWVLTKWLGCVVACWLYFCAVWTIDYMYLLAMSATFYCCTRCTFSCMLYFAFHSNVFSAVFEVGTSCAT